MTHADKRGYLATVKSIAEKDIEWLFTAYNTPNGHETPWSKRVNGAVLKRCGWL